MITAPVFRFEEAKHEYFLNDQRIPGTTELLDKGGHLKGKIYFTDAHRRRGQAVHAMCAQIDLGEITRPPVDAAYRGYVLGWLDFLNQPTLKPIWHRIEEAEVEPTLRFGTRVRVLKTGDIVRSKSADHTYVVTANYGGRVTAVRAVDITNASEWQLLVDRDEERKQ